MSDHCLDFTRPEMVSCYPTIMGECKWSPKVMGSNILNTLYRKTDAVVPTQGNWQIAYVGMARGGWSTEAQTMAEDVMTGESKNGRNWKVSKTMLVDLREIDQDLSDWSR